MSRHRRFQRAPEQAGLDPVETAEHFATRRQQIDTARTRSGRRARGRADSDLTAAGVAKQQLDGEAAELNAELRSLRERKSNIPKRQLDLRAQLCRELRLARGHAAVRRRADRGPRRRSPTGRARRSGCCTPSPCPSWSRRALPRGVRLDRRASPAACASSTTGSRPRRWPAGSRRRSPAAARWPPSSRSRTPRSPPGWSGSSAGRAGRGVRRDDGRVPPGDPRDHQGRAGQGRRPAREGRPVPHRRPQPVRARLEQRAEDRGAARPGRRRSPRGSPRPAALDERHEAR